MGLRLKSGLLELVELIIRYKEVRIYLHAYNGRHIAYILHCFLFEINNSNCETNYFISVSRIPFEWKITN